MAEAVVEKLMTVAEVASIFGVSRWSIYGWTADGRLPFIRLGKGTMRFRADDVAEFVERRRVTSGVTSECAS